MPNNVRLNLVSSNFQEQPKLAGEDSLLSIVQMPAGVPVGTLAIGGAGAENAAILAAQIIALSEPALATRLEQLKVKIAGELRGVVEQVAGKS